jgi:hypothetical protein
VKARRSIIVSAVAATLLASGGDARAQDTEVAPLKILDYSEEVAKEKEGPQCSRIRAVVSSRPGLATKDFVLKELDAEPPLTVEAARAVTYTESDEPLALVILIEGNFAWMGNETYTEPPTSEDEIGETIYQGAFSALAPAVDVLAKAGPPGSQGALFIYADNTIAKQEMADLASLAPTALGTQKDYSELIQKSLVVGLQDAYKALIGKTNFRKVLVVMGDGLDVGAESATGPLREIVGQLKDAEVETYAIYYQPNPDTSDEDKAIGVQNSALIGYTKNYTATSREHFESNAKQIVEFVGARYYVEFDGAALPFDGAEHEFVLDIGGTESEPQAVTMTPVCDKPQPSSGGLWWLWLLIIAAVVLVLVVIIVIAKRKPAPMPQPIPQGPPVDVPPPEPAGPKKTVMFNMGGGGDGYPVVGWIVPLSGPNQYQTFKLLHGVTKIGTGGDSHIVIDDGFMSTHHAEVVCKQSGFVLTDLGSTNGSFFSDQRITEHELVDNDLFVLGKTNFKFKSIN